MMKKTTQFRNLLNSPQVEFLLEAHNGLSATIVQEAGFNGIWGSGLSISAALGVRDNNEASWTQILEVVEFMSDATEIPILLDADTGYGNFNNARRLVRKLEQRQVAAMCIEDKLFPKTNSFISSEKQPLADIDEFAGKIKAAKDSQADDDFSVVARVEALIAGWGMEEALRRADAYYRAGADAILMHSKKSTAEDILEFMRQWGDTCPVVIVPTMYHSTPTEAFEQAGVSLVIWANHLSRTCITAMQKAAAQIHRERSIAAIEKNIVPVGEVFRLQNAAELKEAEKRYLPAAASAGTRTIVLPVRSLARRQNGAAPAQSEASANGHRQNGNANDKSAAKGNGSRQAVASAPPSAENSPVQPLQRQVQQFRQAGVRDITVVDGWHPAVKEIPGIRVVDFDGYSECSELFALSQALELIEGDLVVSFADLVFRQNVLTCLQQEPDDIVIVVDANARKNRAVPHFGNTVRCNASGRGEFSDETPRLVGVNSDRSHGQWIGLLKLSPTGADTIRGAIERLRDKPKFRQMRFIDLFEDLLNDGTDIRVMYINGQWKHVDFLAKPAGSNAQAV